MTGSGNTVKRFGFNGKIADIINDYSLSSSNLVPAIIIKKTSGFRQYDLRMHYRVKPRLGDHSIALCVGTEKMNLIDISIGGAHFCHKKDHPIEPGKIMKATLYVDGQSFNPDIRTLSVWSPAETGRLPGLEYARVQFFNMDKKCSYALNGKIMVIQRELLSEK
ncbi:MAG: PilZ domain-containing protein [Deltaproteobacteria bacterium]|nr:PilZ domain-containing protein [Deltaproteobacteria bacterium]